MNAIPPSMIPGALAGQGFSHAPASHLSLRWVALQDAASVVASLAGFQPQNTAAQVRDFSALICDAAPWRRELADRWIEDMAAVVEPGIAALLGIKARGADSRPAAIVLWREFTEARDAMLALLSPGGTMGPPRSA